MHSAAPTGGDDRIELRTQQILVGTHQIEKLRIQLFPATGCGGKP
jgi:hypothetical protein